MAAPKSAQDILVTELKEIYSAERQLSRALPKIIKRTQSEGFGRLLEQRRDQGAVILEGLDDAFDRMEATKARPKNIAAEGLVEDLNQHLEEIDDSRLLDAVLVGGIQKIEHYCIAAWGTSRALAELLGEREVAQLMQRAIAEGKELDDALTDLAEREINPEMLERQDA